MISSCEECTTKCCRSGPGPYRSVTATDWLTQKQKGTKRYNTACENFDEVNGVCLIWKDAPLVCRTFVCGVRTFTRTELRKIDKLLRGQ